MVYQHLLATFAFAALGAWSEQRLHWCGSWGTFASFGLVIWLNLLGDGEESLTLRRGILFGFGAITGATLAPLIAMAGAIDPAIIPTALVGTATIFACFSAAAIFAKRRSYLYLGGLLSSALTFMLLGSLFSMVFGGSRLLFNVNLWAGLAVFIGFVIFDTQVLIEKSEAGMRDPVRGALELFMDAVGIFVRIVIILSKNKSEKKDRKERK